MQFNLLQQFCEDRCVKSKTKRNVIVAKRMLEEMHMDHFMVALVKEMYWVY